MSNDVSLVEAGKLLLDAQTVALCTHVSPDGDTLGSTLGLAMYLQSQGKTVVVYCDDVITKNFSWMPGISMMQRPSADDKQDVDLLVVIDSSSYDRIGDVPKAVTYKKLLNIDHHISNEKFAEHLYLDASAAAVGEIMVDLFTANQWDMTKDIATCFYTAIATDSGWFRFSNVTPKTLNDAAVLIAAGVKPNEISDALDVRERNTVELLGKVLPSLSFAFDDRVSYLSLTNELYDKNVNTDSFVNYPRSIEGVDVAIFFKAVESRKTRVSMRSKVTDVAAVAVHFGGGGHIRAAGCTIEQPLEEAQQTLLSELGKHM